jgi:hypothetical protein
MTGMGRMRCARRMPGTGRMIGALRMKALAA